MVSKRLHEVCIVSIALLVASAIWKGSKNSKSSYRRLFNLDPLPMFLPMFGYPNSPRLAWLMSFPKGGSTYVQTVIHKSTGTTTANNYGWTVVNGEAVNSRLIWADRTQGPFRQIEEPIPSFPSYLVTNTHCGGWCYDCPPEKYWLPKMHFLIRCVKSSRHNELTQEVVHYDSKMVTAAVHLLRDPFSNTVSRFLMFLERTKDEDFDHSNPITKTGYPMTKEGFQQYCKDMDTKFYNDEYQWFLKIPEMNEAMSGVPCRSEFYKYFQWHNLARIAAIEVQKVPYMLVHYNRFIDGFEDELKRMLTFLQLPEISHNVGNHYYNIYYYFYDIDQVNSIQKLAKYMCDDWLYQELEPYFTDAKDPQERDKLTDEDIKTREAHI